MVRKPGVRKYRDIRVGIVCAQAFQRLAEPFIARIAEGMPEGTVRASGELGDLVACATNLAFALELYIKTLLVQVDSAVPEGPRGHDQALLYNAIPQDVRIRIEARYKEAWRANWYGRRASITIAKGPPDLPVWNDYEAESKQLSELLRRSGDLFQSWRYIYEFIEPVDTTYQLHRFEYGLLLCACQAIEASISK